MNKLITLILFVVSMAVAQTSHAVAPTIKVLPKDVTVDVGQTYTFSVTADNFNHISVQFTLLFNSGLLEFVSFSEINPALQDFNLNYNPPGNPQFPEGLTASWVSPDLNPVSLPNGAVLYKVTLKGKAPGVSQITIPCGGDYVCEAIDGNGNTFNSFPSVAANVTVQGMVVFDGLTIRITEETGAPGTEVCVGFIAEKDFINIGLFQMSIVYDTNLLSFTKINNCNPNLDLDCKSPGANFNIVDGKGFITWNYNSSTDPNGITLPDGSTLFELCFTVLGTLGTIAPIEFQDEQFFKNEFYEIVNDNPVEITDFTLIDGSITAGTGGTKKITINGSNETGSQGTEVCVDITAANFNKLTSLQFGLQWDPSKVTFSKVQACHPSLAIQCGSALNFQPNGNNSLCFDWNEPNPGTGVTLPTNAKLFEVCYNVIGSPGDIADITIGSSANCIATAVDIDGDQFQMVFNNGSITVPSATSVTLKVTDKDVCPGQMVCFPITATNFVNLQSAEFALHFDANVLEFKGIQNCYPAMDLDCDLPSSNFNLLGDHLIFSWLEQGGGCLTLPNGATMFEICFNVIGANGTSSPLEIVANPTSNALELTDCPDGNPVNVITVNQTIEVTSLACCNITIASFVSNPPCKGGSDGSILLTPTGGSGGYTYVWSPNANTPQGGNTATNLPQGTYSATVTDGTGCSEVIFVEVFDGEDFQVTSTVTPANCTGTGGGSITLNITGGIPQTIFWSPAPPAPTDTNSIAATDLPSGSYQAVVKSFNGCIRILDITVPKTPANIDITRETFNANCFGECNGSIVTTVTPANVNYTYQWNTNPVQTGSTATNLCPGTYTVMVTEPGGCTKTASFELFAPNDIIITTETDSAATETTPNGSITAFVTGGTPPYTYKWNTIPVQTTQTATGLFPGIYTVTVTDSHGCTKTAFDTIFFKTVIPPGEKLTIVNPLINEHNGYGVSCFGHCDGSLTAILPNTAVGPFVYQWSNNVPNAQKTATVFALCPGQYSVTVTDDNGVTYTPTQPFIITQPTQLTLNLLTESEPTPTVEAIGGGGVAPYEYKLNDEPYSVINKFNIDGFSPITIILIDDNNCTLTQTIPGPLNRNCEDGRLVITPNGDEINDNFILGCATSYPCNRLTIFDRYGKTVYQRGGYINDWNGVDENGTPLPEGGYFWAFEYFTKYPCPSFSSDVPQVSKGSITIVR